MTKILIASVTNAPASILRAHLRTILNQQLPPQVQTDLCYIADPELSEESALALAEAGARVLKADPKPADAHHAVTSVTHEWSSSTFAWLGKEKQRLLDLAREERYDAIWLVDSDLLCGPDTLTSLLLTEKELVSAVFWTRWQPDMPPLPQVWLRHPYNMSNGRMEEHEFLQRLENRNLVRVGGLGACTLIRSAGVLDRVGYWPFIADLPPGPMSEGEDRHFSIRAARNHVELWADAWPDIFHVYRPEDAQRIDEMLEYLNRPSLATTYLTEDTSETIWQIPTRIGDLVSLALEPCEEPALTQHVEHVRGRLGTLKLLPDVENAVLDMRVGEERFLSLSFPSWYPIAPYRGRRKTVRLRLLGAKPYAPPIGCT